MPCSKAKRKLSPFFFLTSALYLLTSNTISKRSLFFWILQNLLYITSSDTIKKTKDIHIMVYIFFYSIHPTIHTIKNVLTIDVISC
jgi:hypothetical protein